MALKVAQVSDVPNLDQLSEDAKLHLFPSAASTSFDGDENAKSQKKFVVMGHRGSGMNILQSPEPRMKNIKENSIRAFNAAGNFNLDFIEFDVQVTKDGFPVIFHDIFMLTEEKGKMIEKRLTDLSLQEFLSYGCQREPEKVGKPLFRKSKDGRIFEWRVEEDDHLCTLQQVFQQVDHPLGFNIELKFDNDRVYEQEELIRALDIIIQVVSAHAKDRPIIFSSFQPDAVLLLRKRQTAYPVFFLTNGGSEIYPDVRRNSMEEALKLCLDGGLQGIVSEVKAVLNNPVAVKKIQNTNLSLFTYGQLNNVAEVVRVQYLLGVEGVIVDFVKEMSEVVAQCTNIAANEVEEQNLSEEEKIIG